MSETQMEWSEARCRADPVGAAAEIRRLSAMGNVVLTPMAQADLERILKEDPAAGQEIQAAFDAMREAKLAVSEGKYANFEDAMEAMTGERPQEVDLNLDDEEFTVRRNTQGHAEAIECDGRTVLILAAGAERNEEEVENIVDRLNR